MCLKSLYPDLPVTPNVNAYHFLCGRPDQVHWPDFTFHVDAKTGEKRTYREFCARVQLGATALGTPVSEGGLGLRGEDGEVIGIIGRNSSVSEFYITTSNLDQAELRPCPCRILLYLCIRSSSSQRLLR